MSDLFHPPNQSEVQTFACINDASDNLWLSANDNSNEMEVHVNIASPTDEDDPFPALDNPFLTLESSRSSDEADDFPSISSNDEKTQCDQENTADTCSEDPTSDSDEVELNQATCTTRTDNYKNPTLDREDDETG